MQDSCPTNESPRVWSDFETQQFVKYFLRRHSPTATIMNPIEIWSLGIVKTTEQCNEKIRRWREEFLKDQLSAESFNKTLNFYRYLAKKFDLKCDRCGLKEPTGKPLEPDIQASVESLLNMPEPALLCESCQGSAQITHDFLTRALIRNASLSIEEQLLF